MFEQSEGGVGQCHANLQAAGIDRNSVDVVIISHFDGDHVNGLVGPDNKPAFPHAEVMVPSIESTFWMDESNVGKVPEVARYKAQPQRVFGVLGRQGDEVRAGQGAPCRALPRLRAPATRPATPRMSASGNARSPVQADITAGAASVFARNPNGSSCSTPTRHRRLRRVRSSMKWPQPRK